MTMPHSRAACRRPLAGPNCSIALFSARSLALFGRLEGDKIASYVSGMLVGTEMRDALAAWPDLGRSGVDLHRVCRR